MFLFLDANASLDFVLSVSQSLSQSVSQSVTKIGTLSLVERFLVLLSNWLTAWLFHHAKRQLFLQCNFWDFFGTSKIIQTERLVQSFIYTWGGQSEDVSGQQPWRHRGRFSEVSSTDNLTKSARKVEKVRWATMVVTEVAHFSFTIAPTMVASLAWVLRCKKCTTTPRLG